MSDRENSMDEKGQELKSKMCLGFEQANRWYGRNSRWEEQHEQRHKDKNISAF